MRYNIEGTPLPVVICHLDQGETMISEKGSMAWMSPNIKMDTKMNGGVGKAIGRMFSHESMFQNLYTATTGNGEIAFASSFPGSIQAFEIGPNNSIIAQKSSFLASTSGVQLSTYFQKKISTGFFGGEGFIMQKTSGTGIVFLEFDGYVKEYTLAPGETMVLNNGYLAAMESSVTMEVKLVPGIKNKIFGGEGFFNTAVHGPGKIWVQTMPLNKFIQIIEPFFPKPTNNS